jgi:uncharacterized membrane protein
MSVLSVIASRPTNPFRQVDANKSAVAAIVFAVTLFPMVAMIGIGYDYARANATKTALQAALDGALLASAQEVARGRSGDDVQGRVEQALKATFSADHARLIGMSVAAKYDAASGSVSGSAETGVRGAFTALLGATAIDVKVRSQARIDTSSPDIVAPGIAIDAVAAASDSRGGTSR